MEQKWSCERCGKIFTRKGDSAKCPKCRAVRISVTDRAFENDDSLATQDTLKHNGVVKPKSVSIMPDIIVGGYAKIKRAGVLAARSL